MTQQIKISSQARAILALCEKKVELQQSAEEINNKVHNLILKMKALSDKQAGILAAMGEIDEQIERLAHSV